MLLATVLALGAAVMHAGWNFVVKQSPGDRYVTMWGQKMMVTPLLLAVVLIWPPHANAWPWAMLSGLVHIPYTTRLAKGYELGDFSLVYPIARGGGAALGAIGGILFLGDHLSILGLLAIGVVCIGLVALPSQRSGKAVQAALAVAVTIGSYSVCDAKGIRLEGSWRYTALSSLAGSLTLSGWGIATGRTSALVSAVRTHWSRFFGVGLVAAFTYAVVQVAMKFAPVGYVSALRESSVVIAAIAGGRLLGESGRKRRTICSLIVATGLVLLVIAR